VAPVAVCAVIACSFDDRDVSVTAALGVGGSGGLSDVMDGGNVGGSKFGQ
jgi:hypothetical protein